jgi:hypothetical protein
MTKSMGKLEELRDIKNQSNKVHLLFGILRKKENDKITKPIIVREIITDYETTLAILKARMNQIEGNWRIYITVNERDCEKALKELVIDYIKGEKEISSRLVSYYKTCLMQPHNKAERKFLLDIDDKNSIDEIKTILESNNIEILDFVETPNGYHIVTYPFDRRILPKCVDVKPDALKFKEMYIVYKGEM